MKRTFACVTSALFLATATPSLAEEKIVTIGTGSVSGVYYPAGGAICRLMNRTRKETNTRCFAESTGGSINNIQALRIADINFAIIQSDWQYKAYQGLGIFAEATPFTDLRSVFSLHSEMFTIAVAKNSGITNLQGLKGKRVNVGDVGSGMRETMLELMDALHWKDSYFAQMDMKPADAAKALCEGKIDAMVFSVGHPNGLIQDVTINCGAKLIPIEGPEVTKLLSESPLYSKTLIPGGMYRNNAANIPTFGMKAALVTTASMNDDTVYTLTKSVFENFDNFKTLHFVFATLDREKMVNSGLIAPIHPGALRYFKEIGLIKEAPKAKAD